MLYPSSSQLLPSRLCLSLYVSDFFLFFFFQAEDGIRDLIVTGVQTCALPIWRRRWERGLLRSYGILTQALSIGQVIPTGLAAEVLGPRSIKMSVTGY